MIIEPSEKRAAVFIDGQNLFHCAREAFGHCHPNYDAKALAETVCRIKGWRLQETRFYTGIPDCRDNPFWHRYWSAKLAVMGRQGIRVFSRTLRYRDKAVLLPELSAFGEMAGREYRFRVGEEKGVDVRLALDVIRMGHRREYDVALIFSQDQDLSEVADEIRVIAREQGRWLRIASAFPVGPATRNPRGINKTDWIGLDRETYEGCLDRRDYRP